MTDDETAQGRIGQVVDGRYKLTEVMAAGAMGEVYKAERVPVGKLVAVKFLHASFVSDSEFQARFDRETRVMSKLAHPNCVSVVDFGVWKDNPYIVMDFVAGTTLRKRLDDEGAQTPQQALALTRQITAGLAHAHEQGIIHRDIKPANIMISDEIGHGERVRILDFGLARLRGNVGRDATQTNMVVGTPNYMAPEQTVPGTTIDARTDLYAVGVVLFEMVVGERPFAAEDTMALLGMHRGAPIPRLADRVREGTDVPDGLQALIDKAMAKAPSGRFQSAIEMQQAIDEIISQKSGPIVIEPHGKADSAKLKRPIGAAAVGAASTMVADTSDIDETRQEPMRPSVRSLEQPRKSKFWRTLITLMILVGGASAMAAYLIRHRDEHPTTKGVTREDAAVAVAATVDAAAVIVNAPPGDAAVVEIDAAQIAVIAMDAAEAGSGSGSGSGSDEIEIDPEKAEDLDPAKGSADTAEEEGSDAPASNAEAEQKAPAPATPQLASNVHDAVVLIKAGNRQEALASLRILQKKSPKSAYIPFLLGSLYFDQTWWSVSMDNYAQAIHLNVAYKNNPVVNRNLIKMLSSGKTRTRASAFIRGMGRSAIPYLRYAAAHDPNQTVKTTAGKLLKQIH
ncbi:MAG: protein kinase [Deltaproteobacteria bacterium]